MNYKAVFFDFDYTLGDSTIGIVKSANYGLQNLGYQEAEVETIKRTVGLTLKDTFKKLTNNTDECKAEQFVLLFKEKADQVMTDSTELLPYALETLKSLKAKQIHTGIVTTKLHYRITQILEKFHATEFVEYIVGAEDVKVEKPDPEGLLFIIEKMGLRKEEVLYVGDSLVDAKTAQNAGIAFAGVLTGTTTKVEFQEYPHMIIMDDLSKLEDVI